MGFLHIVNQMANDRAFLRISINFFSVFTIVSIVIPYMQVYLAGVGWGVDKIGILLAFVRGAGVFGPLFFSILIRKGLSVRVLISVLSFFVIGLFLMLRHTAGFAGTAVILFLFGFSFSVFIPFTDALANSSLPDPDRQYGRSRVFGTLGFLVPTAVYGITGFPDYFPASSILSVAIAALGFHLITVQFYPAAKLSPRAVNKAEGGLGLPFWGLLGLVFLNRISMAGHYSFFSLYLKETVGIERIGWFWLIGPMSEIPIIFLGGALLKRFPVPVLIGASFAAIAVRLAVYSFFPYFAPVMAVQFLHCFTFGTFQIAAIAGIRRAIGSENMTLGMAVYSGIGMELPAIIGSIGGGFLIAAVGYREFFGWISVIPVIGLLLILLFRRFFFSHYLPER